MGCTGSSASIEANKLPFNEVYKLDNTILGKGGFGVVSLGSRISDGTVVAVKIVTRAGERSLGAEKALLQEWSVMKTLNHPGIIRAFDLFLEERFYSMAVEFIGGGDLFERVVAKENYTEQDAQDLTKNLLLALKYLHDRHIVHRDIKPDNVLLLDATDNTSLKLADFGLAIKLDAADAQLSGGGGTVGYAAPELIKRSMHSKPVDMWAVGCLVYVLLSGMHPFDFGEDERVVNEKVLRNSWSFPVEQWATASADSKDIVRKMLVADPAQRLTVGQALRHPWMTATNLGANDMNKTLAELKAFRAKRNFKKGVRAIMVSNMVQKMSSASALASSSRSNRPAGDSSGSDSNRSSVNGGGAVSGRVTASNSIKDDTAADDIRGAAPTADEGGGLSLGKLSASVSPEVSPIIRTGDTLVKRSTVVPEGDIETTNTKD